MSCSSTLGHIASDLPVSARPSLPPPPHADKARTLGDCSDESLRPDQGVLGGATQNRTEDMRTSALSVLDKGLLDEQRPRLTCLFVTVGASRRRPVPLRLGTLWARQASRRRPSSRLARLRPHKEKVVAIANPLEVMAPRASTSPRGRAASEEEHTCPRAPGPTAPSFQPICTLWYESLPS